MRYAAKVDANQSEIVRALRQVGAAVQSLAAVGGGFPDLLVFFRSRLYLLEVKNLQGRGKRLTPQQEDWRRLFDGASTVVCDSREALEAIGARIR